MIKCFLEVPFACLGSMAAAVQPSCLWNSLKTCNKTFSWTCHPTLYPYKRFVSVQCSYFVLLILSSTFLQPGASGCDRGLVKCFRRVMQAIGLYCSCRAVQASEGNFQKIFYKTFLQPDAPDCTSCTFSTFYLPIYRVSHPIVREILSCFVLGVPLPCLGNS